MMTDCPNDQMRYTFDQFWEDLKNKSTPDERRMLENAEDIADINEQFFNLRFEKGLSKKRLIGILWSMFLETLRVK